MPSEKSHGTTTAPAAANGSLDVPVPAARSSTRSPGLGADGREHLAAPAPVLAHRQHVVGDVVAARDRVEHPLDVGRLLVESARVTTTEPRSAPAPRQPNATGWASSSGQDERRRVLPRFARPEEARPMTCSASRRHQRRPVPARRRGGVRRRPGRRALLAVRRTRARRRASPGRPWPSRPPTPSAPVPAETPSDARPRHDESTPDRDRDAGARARAADRRAAARRQGRAGARAAEPALPAGVAARGDDRRATTRRPRRPCRASRSSGT